MTETLEPCPFCGETKHLSVRAEGSLTPDMPARPYRVCCHHIDHDDVEGPIGYGRTGAIAAWNRRALPTGEAGEVAKPAAVKALEWVWPEGSGHITAYEFGSFVRLTIDVNNGILFDGKYYDSIDDAKAAAQADYERRILSAIAAPPVPTPTGAPKQ